MITTDIVPHNIEAEQAVLGAVFIRPSIYNTLALKAKDFFIHRHGWVWDAFGQLHREGLAIDFITVTGTLEKMGKLVEFGGREKLMGLIQGIPSSLHAEDYAFLVKDMSERRAMISLANDIAKVAYDYKVNLDDLKQVFIDDLLKSTNKRGGAVHISEWIDETLLDIEARAGQEEEPLLKTEYQDLDHFIGGLDPSEGTQMILGGEPGTGKTILLGNVSFNLAKQAPGALYSMEMKRKRLMMRAFSARSRVSAWEMRRGKVSGEGWDKILETAEEYRKLNLFVSDSSRWNTSTLRADLTRLKYEKGIQWYVLDYMKLLGDEAPRGAKEHERLEEISGRLLKINRDLSLCSIIIHTMNKDNFKKDNLSGGAFSGGAGLQYDMDIGCVLVSSDTKHSDVYEYRKLVFTKNRDGETPLGELELAKYREIPLFVTPYLSSINSNGYHKQVVKI